MEGGKCRATLEGKTGAPPPPQSRNNEKRIATSNCFHNPAQTQKKVVVVRYYQSGSRRGEFKRSRAFETLVLVGTIKSTRHPSAYLVRIVRLLSYSYHSSSN
jgi:hypothetical protein